MVVDSCGDLCFSKRFEDEKKDCYSFNLILPETYTIYPEPCNATFSAPKKLIKNVPFPKFERTPPDNYEIIYDNSIEGYACCYQDYGVICVNDNFYKCSQPDRIFILMHELSHFYYDTEKYADDFADYMFYKAGFNPSSALSARTKYLSDNDEEAERKIRAHQKILNYQC